MNVSLAEGSLLARVADVRKRSSAGNQWANGRSDSGVKGVAASEDRCERERREVDRCDNPSDCCLRSGDRGEGGRGMEEEVVRPRPTKVSQVKRRGAQRERERKQQRKAAKALLGGPKLIGLAPRREISPMSLSTHLNSGLDVCNNASACACLFLSDCRVASHASTVRASRPVVQPTPVVALAIADVDTTLLRSLSSSPALSEAHLPRYSMPRCLTTIPLSATL